VAWLKGGNHEKPLRKSARRQRNHGDDRSLFGDGTRIRVRRLQTSLDAPPRVQRLRLA
jgi:hypothetical protein